MLKGLRASLRFFVRWMSRAAYLGAGAALVLAGVLMLGFFRFFYDTRRYRFRLFPTKADPKATGGERPDARGPRPGPLDRTAVVSFRAEPNLLIANPPIRSGQGIATLTWTVSAPVVEIRAESSRGRKVCDGGSSGVAKTGPLERTSIFYLQDASRGDPRDPDKTLARVEIAVRAPRPVTFTAEPNPAHITDGSGTAVVTLRWTAPDTDAVAIRVNSPDGPVLATGGSCETLATDQWVTNGMVFFLQDVSQGDAPDRRITIGRLEVGVIDPVYAELVQRRTEGARTADLQADLQAVSSPLSPEGPIRYGVKRVPVTFSPESVLAGEPYRVSVPDFAGQVIDVGYELTGGQFSTPVIGVVNKWCELDLQGEAVIVTPANHPEGLIRITRVRSQMSNGAWHQAAGEIQVAASR